MGDVFAYQPSISPNGRYVSFENIGPGWHDGASNDETQAYVRDLELGTTTLVSRHANGADGNANSGKVRVSDDAEVAFASFADNLIDDDLNETRDVFVSDARTGLWLTSSNEAPAIAEPFTLASGGAGPSARGLLFVTSIDGLPFWQLVLEFGYDAQGRWSLSTSVPPSRLSGVDVGLTAFGLLCNGDLEQSDELIIDIQ